MISKMAIRLVALLGAAWSIVPACASTSQGTDSNTHWIACNTVADCPDSVSFSCIGGRCENRSGDDSGTPSTGGPCPSSVSGNQPCNGTVGQCWTPCVNGTRGQFVCSDGTWLAGHGLFPCGPDGGSAGSGGTPGSGGTAGNSGTGGSSLGGSIGTGGFSGAHVDGGRTDGGRADSGSCEPMDAHTGHLPCVSIVGYTWTGSDCSPVVCSCEGADCASMYPTVGECLGAHVGCATLLSIQIGCQRNSDCTIVDKTCCSCQYLGEADKVAINVVSQSVWQTSTCEGVSCLPCSPIPPGPYQAVCVAGRCEVKNILSDKPCLASQFCVVSPVDCCACGQLTSRSEVTALGTGFEARFPQCSASCPPCPGGVQLPPGVTASCYLGGGYCVLD